MTTSALALLMEDVAPLADAPARERHLAEPERWLVVEGGAQVGAPVVLATAVSVIQGWLLLWRFEVLVGVFRPGTWDGAYARV